MMTPDVAQRNDAPGPPPGQAGATPTEAVDETRTRAAAIMSAWRRGRGAVLLVLVVALFVVMFSVSPAKQVVQALFNGVEYGLLIALAAVGMSVIFGTTGVVNFAHGNFLALGALLTYVFNSSPSGPQLYVVPAALLAIVAVALVGGLLEWQVMRRIRAMRTSLIAALVFLIGLEIASRNALLYFFGADLKSYRNFVIQQRINWGPFSFLARDVWIIAIAVVGLGLLALALRFTRVGQAVRAVSDNPSLAEASGIPVDRVIRTVWIVGTGYAALSGVLLAVSQEAVWNMGFQVMLLMFAAMIIGGVGSALGATLGGIAIGLVMNLGSIYLSTSLQVMWALLAMILVLVLRPEGLFAIRKRLG